MKKKLNKKNIINCILFLFFISLTFIIAKNHELWRDEAQSWLLSRDLSLKGLFNELSIEGHPFMWYLCLKIFISWGLSYKYLWLIPLIINMITIYLVIYKMPYPFWVKIPILLSYPFIYLGVFARSYVLLLFFMVLIMMLYKNRYKHYLLFSLLLFCLINTHIILIGFSISLIILEIIYLIKDKSNQKEKLFILSSGIIGIICLILELYGGASSTQFISISLDFFKYAIDLIDYITLLPYLSILLMWCILLLIYYLIKNKKYDLLLILILSYGAIIVISYGVGVRYYLCFQLLVILLFIIWNIKSNKFINLLTFGIFLSTLFLTSYFVKNDFHNLYSSSLNTALYIEDNIPKNTELYCLDTAYCSSIIPYLKKHDYSFIDAKTNKEFTYVNWNEYYVKRDLVAKKKMLYYIALTKNELEQWDNYDIIYESPKSITNESYIIIKFREE